MRENWLNYEKRSIESKYDTTKERNKEKAAVFKAQYESALELLPQ